MGLTTASSSPFIVFPPGLHKSLSAPISFPSGIRRFEFSDGMKSIRTRFSESNFSFQLFSGIPSFFFNYANITFSEFEQAIHLPCREDELAIVVPDLSVGFDCRLENEARCPLPEFIQVLLDVVGFEVGLGSKALTLGEVEDLLCGLSSYAKPSRRVFPWKSIFGKWFNSLTVSIVLLQTIHLHRTPHAAAPFRPCRPPRSRPALA